MNKVLVVVDAQEDFTRGTLRNEDAIAALPKIHEIVEFAKENEMTIIYTADTHNDKYLETQEGRNLPVPHCIIETDGWKICPEAVIGNTITIVQKNTFGSLDWKSFPVMENTMEIWMCGFCTDICVSANFQTIKATYPETPIVVIEDACAGVTPELHKCALNVMKSCQGRIEKWDNLKRENSNEA